MVYSVGESITMIADLLADFSTEGWCYVSFVVKVADGPVIHDDTYYIDSFPDPRIFISECLLSPELVSPGVDGESLLVIFTTEVYDNYSMGGTDTVTVNVTRGTLNSNLTTSNSLDYGENHTLQFQLYSSENPSIPLSNGNIRLRIYDSEDVLVFENSSTTNSDGCFSSIWGSKASPGEYHTEIEFTGNDCFYPLLENHSLEILPPFSSLHILNYTTDIYGMTSDGLNCDQVDVYVKHTGLENVLLNDSSLTWQTNFSSGFLIFQESGIYFVSIPFNVTFGEYELIITAENSVYQTAEISANVSVHRRQINGLYLSSLETQCNQTLSVSFSISDFLTDAGIPDISAEMSISINSIPFFEIITTSNSSGYFTADVFIPTNKWGSALFQVEINESIFYTSYYFSTSISISYNYSIDVIPPSTLFLGDMLEIPITITNPNDTLLSGHEIFLYDSNGILIAENISSTDFVILSWFIPENYSDLSFDCYVFVEGNPLTHQLDTYKNLQFSLKCPIFLNMSTSDIIVERNSTTTIFFTIETYSEFSETLEFSLIDELSGFTHQLSFSFNKLQNYSISAASSTPLGIHNLCISPLNASFDFYDEGLIPYYVLGRFFTAVNISSAFYGQNMTCSCLLTTDLGEILSHATIDIFYNNIGIPIFSESNTSITSLCSIPLPLNIYPGSNNVTFRFSKINYLSDNLTLEVVVWMKTQLILNVIPLESTFQDDFIESDISSGSIISPPPILLNLTTSLDSDTTRETSPDSCPRFNSGTSIRSTVSENSLTILSGNGQTVLSLKDLIELSLDFIIISSTDREVQPNEIIPHSAVFGPSIIKSLRYSDDCSTLFTIRLTKSLCVLASEVFRKPSSS